MKLYWYKCPQPNFGDELNNFVWPKIIPEILDDDSASLVLGIGSILFNTFPATVRKHVLGSGYGAYTPAPNVNDGTWNIYFVRGPRTADAIGVSRSLSICDSGILVRQCFNGNRNTRDVVSFIPHWASINRGRWDKVCLAANINYIDPHWEVEKILREIDRSTLVIAEAMHGAIVADALRVPWIPVLPLNECNHFKWIDWAESMEIKYSPEKLLPSSVKELKLTKFQHNRYVSKVLSMVDQFPTRHIAKEMMIELSAKRLEKIAEQEPVLSKDSIFDRNLDAIMANIDQFKKDNK